ncbi:DUF530 domain-containing protein [Methanobrevibacter filiformis]|uniref:Uncharacterized protein n=1 Tax=Methanobrevibacter filiformis TaxID=55758 RepID=A0A166D262_9EURY|nr:DUF530 domain-containing protein [Methanobrevibacter filiformis]KZX15124.1 hypothetical protein MBFIL_07250 [Methanobrevibacter filiformis]
MDESVLIGDAEKYLKKIGNEPLDLNGISDLDIFKSLYLKLSNRLDVLQSMKENMDAKGYTAPYRALSRYGMGNSSDVSFEEVSEVNKYGQYFRMKASAKKNILNRVKSAIDAHKIAIGNLDEYGLITCNTCSKSYRPSSLESNGLDKCICGSSDLYLKLKKHGICRLEILSYLPLSGNYMVLMSKLSRWGRESFKKILKNLKQEKKGSVKTVSLIIKIRENNRWISKRVNLDSEYVNSYEEKIREDYGNVRIKHIQFHRTKPTIINDRNARTALALAYAMYSERLIKEHLDEILSIKLRDYDNLKKYDNIIYKIGLEKPNFLSEKDSLDEWRKSKIIESLQKEDLMDKNEKLTIKLAQDKKTRKILEDKVFSNLGLTLILWDIFKYYLTKSNDRRKRHSGPFPYLRGDIDRQQRQIFTHLNKQAINILKTYACEKIIEINEMDLILYEKFKLEKQMKGLNMKINHVALGAALLLNNSNDLDISTLAYAFDLSEKEIKTESKNLTTVSKPRTNKSKQFLKMIKS